VRAPVSVGLAGSPRRLPHDAVVARQGEPTSYLYLVERGAIRLSCVTADGREIVVGILGPGDVFGEAALLEEPSPVDARSIGPATLIAFDASLLPFVFRESPATGAELLRLVAARLRRTERTLGDALTSDLATRIAHRLGELVERHGAPDGDGTRIALPLTQEELARMVGASREAVNRSLKALVARDLVRTTGRGLVIPDPDALAPAP
jgi:CRP/FNR family transcriptional regulator